jgi:hypothetical protein
LSRARSRGRATTFCRGAFIKVHGATPQPGAFLYFECGYPEKRIASGDHEEAEAAVLALHRPSIPRKVRTSFVAVARGVSCQEEEHVLGRQGDGTPSRRPLPICGILWRREGREEIFLFGGGEGEKGGVLAGKHRGTFCRAMEAYHSGTDDILGVCGEEETETGLAHTPRYEPSWFYQEVPSEMVERCLRARSRGGIDEAAALWLHKHLVALGHAANAHSCHFMAHSWFECAYGLKDGAPELISSINMRLRLGQATLAKQLYERMLQQREVPRSK